jgi:transcriptional regulator with XRE-family HTH domain
MTKGQRKKTPRQEAIGRAIREARREKGWSSHEKFAQHVGLDRGYLGAIERGEFNISLATLKKFADALDMSIAELFRRAGL